MRTDEDESLLVADSGPPFIVTVKGVRRYARPVSFQIKNQLNQSFPLQRAFERMKTRVCLWLSSALLYCDCQGGSTHIEYPVNLSFLLQRTFKRMKTRSCLYSSSASFYRDCQGGLDFMHGLCECQLDLSFPLQRTFERTRTRACSRSSLPLLLLLISINFVCCSRQLVGDTQRFSVAALAFCMVFQLNFHFPLQRTFGRMKTRACSWPSSASSTASLQD